MSLSANALYRSVSLSWNNYDASGSEFVQVYAKPSGGSWSLVLTVPVAGLDQTAEWGTALPLTAYEIAMRFVNVTVPTAGYEGADPDLWTAPTAAQSKTTVTTGCAAVTGLAGSFVNAASPVALSWICAQQGVTFLLEKNIGAGWVTVASGLTAQSYPYPIPGAELATTVQFRVTPRNGATSGTTSDAVSIYMGIIVGTPTWVSGTFAPTTASVTLTWLAATNALAYLVEKSANGGASWSALATTGSLTLTSQITAAEANLTMKYRVTGQNGTVSGTPSAAQDVATTIAVGAPSNLQVVQAAPGSWYLSASWDAGTGSIVSYWLEASEDGASWWLVAAVAAPGVSIASASVQGKPWNVLPAAGFMRVVAQSYGQIVSAPSASIPVSFA